MKSKNKVIVFGASGLIGSYLYELLKKEDFSVIGTYNNNPKPEMIHFDLISSSLNEIDLNGIKYGIISSAVTKLDKCKDNQQYSYEANVTSVKRIINELVKNGIIPVFLSSAAVFDGEKGGYKEDDKKNPISVYGEQKAEIEDFLISNLEEYLIVRPGKVFGIKKGEGVLFSEWLEKYKKGEEIRCADDEQISPTYAGDVARAIMMLLKKGCNGIYNINYPKHYSRYEMAMDFFEFLGIKNAEVIKCSINDFNFSEKRMINSFMDSSKLIKEVGFCFTPLRECYIKICRT